jgi:hypothetical protein
MSQNPLFPPEVPFPEPHPSLTEHVQPPVPVVFEDDQSKRMSLRTHAAIQLRVPDSGIDCLDQMIERSRKLDRQTNPSP